MSAMRRMLKIPKKGKSIKPIITDIEMTVIDMIMEDAFGALRIFLAIVSPPLLILCRIYRLSNEFACIE